MDTQTPTPTPVINQEFPTPPLPLVDSPVVQTKNKYPLIIGACLVGLVVVGVGGYYLGQQSSKPSSEPTNDLVAITQLSSSPSPVLLLTSPSPATTTVATNSLPEGWKYTLSQQKNNANECVKIALPPMKPPYVYTLDENRAPSVTEDKGSGRFWYLGGATYPNLLSKIGGADLAYTQNMAIFATEIEASGYISQAVAVTCMPNTASKDNSGLIWDLDDAISQYNNSTREKSMEPLKYTLKITTPTKRWGKDVIDYTVDADGQESKYTLFATPQYIYEIKIIGGSPDTFVKETAQKIFDNLNFN